MTTPQIKDITVLFADLRNFALLSKSVDPIGVMNFLNEYYEKLGDVVAKYDGTIDKFIGDAIMVTFNTEKEQYNHAELAVRTAIEMRETLWKWDYKIGGEKHSTMFGINTGKAAVGYVGSRWRKELTVIGDTVNIAAILVGKADADQILITDKTYKIVEGIVEAEELPVKEWREILIKPYQVFMLKPGANFLTL